MTEKISPPTSSLLTPVTIATFRLIGYGLIIMGAFNLADIMLPPQFMNPVWEMETAGAIVESVPIPLLGIMLVFCGDNYLRKPWEPFITWLLSWMCLMCAILFLVLFPLIASNTIRINEQIVSQRSDQFQQQMDNIDQLEEQLNQATNSDIVSFLESQGISVEEAESGDVRTVFLERVAAIRQQVREQNTTTTSNQRRAVFKNAFKWTIGSLISSFIFLWIWRLTKWTRFKKPKMISKQLTS